MSHTTIFDLFANRFPNLNKDLEEWFPNGKNSIRVRLTPVDDDLIVTYDEQSQIWEFESMDRYLEKMKGAQMMKC